MPPRLAFGDSEVAALEEAVAYYRNEQLDPGYQGIFEERYTGEFVKYMGGGYADAVATGTAALFVAIAALELPAGSKVIVSPITDPGTLAAIILNRLVPCVADSAPGSYGMGIDQFSARIADDVRAAVIVHSIGRAVDIDAICEKAEIYGIKIVEDCAQSHGAKVRGRPVGSFGDIAAFSTMYRKAHIAGASGGVVYSRHLELFKRALAHADRGKPRWEPDFDDRNPSQFLFPALNLHTDELSCAIGAASLKRLQNTIFRRLTFLAELSTRLLDRSSVCRPYGYTPNDSPFIYPIVVDVDRIACSKREFAEAIRAEGIPLNPHYEYLVTDWPWLKPYCADQADTPNARSIRDRTFCLYLNENYGTSEASDCVRAITKVERHFAR